jgi:hypothetical protein
MDNSIGALAELEWPRRRITVPEFTLKYQEKFPGETQQEAEQAFTSMIWFGAFCWVEEGVFECVTKREFASIASDFQKYIKCTDSSMMCSWLESLL